MNRRRMSPSSRRLSTRGAPFTWWLASALRASTRRWASTVTAVVLIVGSVLFVGQRPAQAVAEASLAVSELVDGLSSETVISGQVVAFSTTVSNAGPSAATGVNVSDLLPSGLTFGGSSSPSGTSYNSTTGTWAVGTLAAGESETLTIVASVTSSASSYTDTATVSANDATSVNSSATVNVTAAVGVSLAAYPGDIVGSTTTNAVESGQDVTYLVTASNTGAAMATNVIVTDALPLQFTLNNTSITPSVGTVSVNAGILTWTIPTLAAGSDATLSYNETTNAPSSVQTDTTSASITSTQTNQYGNSSNQASDAWSLEVIPAASVSIITSDGVTSVVPGTPDTYTTVVNNNGPSALTNATVFDTVPVGFDITQETSSLAGVTFTNLGDGQVEWTGINVASGQSATLTLTGLVDPGIQAGGAFVNQATLEVPAGQIDTNSTYNATDSDTISPNADLSVELSDNAGGTFDATNNDTTGGTAVPGDSVTYTLVAANTGPSDASGVYLSNPVPSQISSDTWTVSGTSGGASATTSSGTGNISDTLNLPSGSSVTYTVDANIAADATGALVDTATLTPPSGITDTDAFTTSTDLATLSPQNNLSLTNSDGVTSVTAGASDTYTISVSNSGPSDATGVSVVDTLPGQMADVASTGTLPTGVVFSDLGDGQVEWTGINLASGGNVSLSFSGTVPSDESTGTGTYVNAATVIEGPGATDTNSTDTATDTDNVVAEASLAVSELVDGLSSETVISGQVVAFSTTVSNAGPSAATGVNVSDLLPSGLTFGGSSSPSGTSYNSTTGTWAVGTLAAGESETLTIVASVTSSASSYTDTATVSANDATSVNSLGDGAMSPPRVLKKWAQRSPLFGRVVGQRRRHLRCHEQ